MPPKDRTLPEMYILQPDGTKIKIGKIQAAEIVPELDDEYDITGDRLIMPQNTATFTVTWNPTVDTMHLLIKGRLPYNNWRKMHGFPLRRKNKRK